jgi:hypothetical protein
MSIKNTIKMALIKTVIENFVINKDKTKNALAGNRTRAARVAGEHSTTEPPVLLLQYRKLMLLYFSHLITLTNYLY